MFQWIASKYSPNPIPQRPDIDVSLASSSGYTSLITACYKNQVLTLAAPTFNVALFGFKDLELVKQGTKLLQPHSGFYKRQQSFYFLLVPQILDFQVGIAQLLLARDDVEPNWVSDEGDSLVMTCCVRGYTEVLISLDFHLL